MAARIDFDYLHTLAAAPEDHATLNRIEADREVLLSGGSLEIPGGPLPLSLRLGAGELAPEAIVPAQPTRTIHLTLRSDLAPASMDTFLEIFRDHVHALLPGFSGEAGGNVVDLGANEGFYTLRMKLLNPDLRVVAAEPVAENVALFRDNIAANDMDGVTILETAVTDREGRVTLETLPHVGTVASTDILAFPRPWISSDEIDHREVATTTLEGLLDASGIEEAEILKLDVEGSEVDILSCNRQTLRRCRRVVVECHGGRARARVRAFLEGAGFASLYDEEKRSGDLYFVRF